jgi:hypothetical protein
MKIKTVFVRHLGKDVQVRPIPPKLQRMIHAKAANGGRINLQELMVRKLVHGLENPNFTEAEARRITQRFTLRTLQPIIDQIDRLSGTEEHLRGADRPYEVRKITEPAMVTTAWLRRFPDIAPTGSRSRESHGAKPVRCCGSRRGERATSSSSDDPDPEPRAARPCACGCGHPRQQGDNYNDPVECKRRHARERKRAQRARDRREGTERHVERRLKARALAALGPEPCKCEPRPGFSIPDPEGDLVCCACGRHRVMPRLKRVNSFDASAVDMQQLDRLGSPRTKRGEVAA